MIKALVTGGAGFVGSHLVERLVKSGREVTVIDDLSNGRHENLVVVEDKITFLHRDITKYGLVSSPVGPVSEIYHLACYPRQISFKNPARDMEVNLGITIKCLEFARMAAAKVLFTSNTGIVSKPERLPVDESFPPSPLTPYDCHKLASEHLLRVYSKYYGVRTCAVRFASIYGPRQQVNERLGWHPVIPEFTGKLLRGEQPTIHGDGRQSRDFLYVKDAVAGLIQAMESNANDGGMFILGTNKETSINQLYQAIVKELNCESVQPRYGPARADDILRMRYDYTKAKAAFGFDPKTTIEDGLTETMLFARTEEQLRRLRVG